MSDEPNALDLFSDEAHGRVVRRPRLRDHNYLVLSAISESLEKARDRYVGPGSRILDVGCGNMPYVPLLATVASDYAGADLEAGPGIRFVGPVETLAADEQSFDLVLCTQVLEHVRDPHKVLSEVARVLRPGGYALITTHGVYPFHPIPADYWRWTQEGLAALIEDTDGLDLVEIIPHRGSAACLALMAAYYIEMAATHARVAPAAAPFVALVNLLGLALDRISPQLHFPNPSTLVANFLLVANRSG